MRAYISALARHWRALVTGLTGTLALLVADEAMTKRYIPAWLWVGVLAATVVVAQILVYRDVANERDKARADIEYVRTARALSVGDITLAKFVGNPVDQSGVELGVKLKNYGSTVVEFRMESMLVVIDGKTRQHQPPTWTRPKLHNRGPIVLELDTELDARLIHGIADKFGKGDVAYRQSAGGPYILNIGSGLIAFIRHVPVHQYLRNDHGRREDTHPQPCWDVAFRHCLVCN